MAVPHGLACCTLTLLDTKVVLAALGGRDSTKVPGTDPSHCEVIYREFSYVFEKPGNPLEGAIKHEFDLLSDSVPPAKRYRISPVGLFEVRKQLNEYLSKG